MTNAPVHSAWQWANKIGPVGDVEDGRPNTAEVGGHGRHFSVFHLPVGTTPDGVLDYMMRREAVGAAVQMAEMSMDALERHVLVSEMEPVSYEGLPYFDSTGTATTRSWRRDWLFAKRGARAVSSRRIHQRSRSRLTFSIGR